LVCSSSNGSSGGSSNNGNATGSGESKANGSNIPKQLSVLDAGQRAFFSKLSQTQQVELLQGYNDFSSELKQFLLPFSQTGKEVTKQDIAQFLDQMKKRRTRSKPTYF